MKLPRFTFLKRALSLLALKTAVTLGYSLDQVPCASLCELCVRMSACPCVCGMPVSDGHSMLSTDEMCAKGSGGRDYIARPSFWLPEPLCFPEWFPEH